MKNKMLIFLLIATSIFVFSGISLAAPQITSPTAGANLSENATFRWSCNGCNISKYYLRVWSRTSQTNYHFKGWIGSATSKLVPKIPQDGRAIYAQVYGRGSGGGRSSVKNYVGGSSANRSNKAQNDSNVESGPRRCSITGPLSSQGSLTEENMKFQVDKGSASRCYLAAYPNATGTGRSFSSGWVGSRGEKLITRIPLGSPISFKLYSMGAGGWSDELKVYQTEGDYVEPQRCTITSPLPSQGSLNKGRVTFKVDKGSASRCYLAVYPNAAGTGRSFYRKWVSGNGEATVSGIPLGNPISLKFYSMGAGGWGDDDELKVYQTKSGGGSLQVMNHSPNNQDQGISVPRLSCSPSSCNIALPEREGESFFNGTNLYLGKLEMLKEIFTVQGIDFNLGLELFYSENNIGVPSEFGGKWSVNRPFVLESQAGNYVFFMDGKYLRLIRHSNGAYYVQNHPNVKLELKTEDSNEYWQVSFLTGVKFYLQHKTDIGGKKRWDITKKQFNENVINYQYEVKNYTLTAASGNASYDVVVPYIKTIVDEIGRKAVFTYKTDQSKDNKQKGISLVDYVELKDKDNNVFYKYKFDYDKALKSVDQVEFDTSKTYQERQTLGIAYDSNKKLKSVTNSYKGVITYDYNNAGLIKSVELNSRIKTKLFTLQYGTENYTDDSGSSKVLKTSKIASAGKGYVRYGFNNLGKGKGLTEQIKLFNEQNQEVKTQTFGYLYETFDRNAQIFYQNLKYDQTVDHRDGNKSIRTNYSQYVRGNSKRIDYLGFLHDSTDDTFETRVYDPNTLLMKHIEEKDATTNTVLRLEDFTYNSKNLLESEQYCLEYSNGTCTDELKISYTYDSVRNRRKTMKREGTGVDSRITTSTYGVNDALLQVAPATINYNGDLLVTNTYAADNALLTTDDPISTVYTYDFCGSLVKQQYGSIIINHESDYNRQPIKYSTTEAIDENTNRVMHQYFDGFSNLVQKNLLAKENGKQYTWHYDITPVSLTNKHEFGITDGDGRFVSDPSFGDELIYWEYEYTHDPLLEVFKVNNNGRISEMSGDIDSASITFPTGYNITESFDVYGKPVEITHPNHSVVFDEDVSTRTTTITKSNTEKEVTRNMLGEVKLQKFYLGKGDSRSLHRERIYEHDVDGNLSSTYIRRNELITKRVDLFHDGANRLRFMDDYVKKGVEYFRDFNNSALTSEIRNGRTIEAEVDTNGNVTEYGNLTLTYDGIYPGRITEMHHENGNAYYRTYNNLDQITETRWVSFGGRLDRSIKWKFHVWGPEEKKVVDNLDNNEDAFLSKVSFTYDDKKVLKQVHSIDNMSNSEAVFTYNNKGEMTQIIDRNNGKTKVMNFTYDPPYQVDSVNIIHNDGTSVTIDDAYLENMDTNLESNGHITRNDAGEVTSVYLDDGDVTPNIRDARGNEIPSMCIDDPLGRASTATSNPSGECGESSAVDRRENVIERAWALIRDSFIERN